MTEYAVEVLFKVEADDMEGAWWKVHHMLIAELPGSAEWVQLEDSVQPIDA